MAIYGTLDAKAMGTDVVATNGDATVTTAGDFTDASDNLVKVGDILEAFQVLLTLSKRLHRQLRLSCTQHMQHLLAQ